VDQFPPGPIPVIAAVVRRDGRYLVGRRPAEKRHGGLWEFPGGKVHEGEAMLDAADRELQEELGMSASGAGAVLLSASDDDAPFVIHFVEVEAEGDPVALEHSEVGWFTPEELAALPLAPADARFVRTLVGPVEG
jgi:mutator protein MutT